MANCYKIFNSNWKLDDIVSTTTKITSTISEKPKKIYI